MEGTQKIEKNGKASVSILFDVSQFSQSFQSIAEDVGEHVGSTSGGEVTVSGFDCTSVDSQESVLKNLTCVEKGGEAVLLSGTTQLKKPAFTVRKSGKKRTYTYRVSDVLRLLSTPDNPVTVASLKEGRENPIAASARLTYTIIMPGRVTHADIGTMKGDAVTFDLRDLTKSPKAMIRSEDKQ